MPDQTQYDFPADATDAEKKAFIDSNRSSFDKFNDVTNRLMSNAGSMMTGKPMSGPKSPMESVQSPPESINRMKWGTLGAATGLPGGGIGAALTGAGAAASPPKSWGDAINMGIGGLAGGLWGKAEKGIEGLGAFGKAMVRGGAGAAQDLTEKGVKSALGEKDESGPLSTVASGGLSMLAGGLGDRALKSVNVNNAQKFKNTLDSTAAAENSPAGTKLASDLHDRVMGNVVAAKQQRDDAVKKLAELEQQQARGIIDEPVTNVDKARLAMLGSDVKKIRKQLPALENAPSIAQQSGIPLDAKVQQMVDLKTGKLITNPPDLIQQSNAQAQQLSQQLDKIKQQKLDPVVEQAATSGIQQQIQQLDSKVAEQKSKNLLAAAQSKDVGHVLTGKIMEQESIVKKLNSQLQNEDTAFNLDPQLKALVGDGSLTTFKQNFSNAPAETIEKLQNMWANDPKGVGNMKTLQKMAYQDIFEKAYSQGGWKDLDKSLGANGNWNPNKLQALFGGGGEGYATANKFSTTVKDLVSLTSPAVSAPGILGHAKLAAVALPAAIALHIPMHMGMTGASLGALAVLSVPTMIDKAMANPKLYKALHDWVTNGATAEALRQQPFLKTWIDNNSTSY